MIINSLRKKSQKGCRNLFDFKFESYMIDEN